jgi:hypothetical protein
MHQKNGYRYITTKTKHVLNRIIFSVKVPVLSFVDFVSLAVKTNHGETCGAVQHSSTTSINKNKNTNLERVYCLPIYAMAQNRIVDPDPVCRMDPDYFWL